MGTPSRADAYGRHTGRYSAELADAFVRFAGVSPEMRALDVGCGPGALTERIAAIVGAERVAAVDPSEEYLDAARRRVPGAELRLGAAEHLPFEDDCFDCVLAQLVVQVLDDAPKATREMLRVTAPGGTLATCVWDFQGGMPLLDAYWGAAMAVDPEGASRAGGDTTNPWCTAEGLVRLWSEAGAEDVQSGEVSASAEYEGFEDAWWSFESGPSPSAAYCRSLDEQRRVALREEFRRRLGAPSGRFRLAARAWVVRGRAPLSI